MAQFDIAIVGNGVAAAAAALSLCDVCEKRLAVIIVACPARARARAGEVLSAASQQELQALRLWDEFAAQPQLAADATFSCWGSPLLVERNDTMSAHASGWYLDRPRFESLLWDKVKARSARLNIDFRHCRVQHADFGDDRNWRLSLRDGSKFGCRIAIDCSGRSSVVARTRTGRTRLDRLVAAYSFLEQNDHEVTPTVATLIEAVPDGWWYSALLPDRRMIAGLFTDTDLLPRGLRRDPALWRRTLDTSEYTLRRIVSAGFASAGTVHIANAGTTVLDRYAGRGWIAAGDAAMTFDPLSSHGIATAMWSGRHAARAAVAALAGDDREFEEYGATMSAGFSAYRKRHNTIYGMERRFSTSPFWQRRHHGFGSAGMPSRHKQPRRVEAGPLR